MTASTPNNPWTQLQTRLAADVRDRPWAYNFLDSACDVLGIKDNRRAERSAHWLTMTASWDDGSPPVRKCPLWSTEPGAVHLCRPI